MAKGDALTSGNGAVFVQPGGPNALHALEFLKCETVGDIAETEKALDLIRCHDPAGAGYLNVGRTEGPPEPVTFTIDELVTGQRSWLEKADCPMAVYLLLNRCGPHNLPWSYVRGLALTRVERVGRTHTNWVNRDGDDAAGTSIDLWAYPRPDISDIETLLATRVTSAVTNALNDVIVNRDRRCLGDCDEAFDPGDEGLAVGDSAAGPAVASILFTDDAGLTWAQAAAPPLAAGAGAMSCCAVWVGPNTRRYIVGLIAPAGGQGQVAYTDNGGTTWTSVNVGGAAAGHGANDSQAFFALDYQHCWLASAEGYIYFSDDGFESVTAQEAGVLGVGDYNCIHFADEFYGVAAGVGDQIAITSDGGDNWALATATGGGGDMLCCWRFDSATILLGDDDGKLWCSNDGGTSWTQVTGWPGSGTGDIVAMEFYNKAVGFMLHNSGAAVGTILFTYSGGRLWQAIDTPTNSGLNAISVGDESHAIAVGELQGGTTMIIKVEPAAAS